MSMLAHPAAELFPVMTEEALEALAADIREQGLLEPIITHGGQVLDGRHRLEACRRAGVPPRFVEWDGQGGSPELFVVSRNLHRRHLTASQRAALAVAILPRLEEEARERMAEGGRGGKISTPSKARDKAAELVAVSPRYVSDAKRIADVPELFDEVRRGEKTIPEAKATLRQRKAQQDVARREKRAAELRHRLADGGHAPPAAEEALEEALAAYERAEAELGAERKAAEERLRPFERAVQEARDRVRGADRRPGLFVEEAHPDEELQWLTEDELWECVVPVWETIGANANGTGAGWHKIGWETGREFGVVSFKADVRDMHILQLSEWEEGPEQPSPEHKRWAVEFPKEDGRYYRRAFWFPSSFSVPPPGELAAAQLARIGGGGRSGRHREGEL